YKVYFATLNLNNLRFFDNVAFKLTPAFNSLTRINPGELSTGGVESFIVKVNRERINAGLSPIASATLVNQPQTNLPSGGGITYTPPASDIAPISPPNRPFSELFRPLPTATPTPIPPQPIIEGRVSYPTPAPEFVVVTATPK